MVQIENIHKTFGSVEVLKGVNLFINKGDVNVILGQSGSGKTTLLRCINFLERPDSGDIHIGDIHANFKTATPKQILEIRRRTGFVFQNYSLFRNKTALENVAIGLTVARKVPRAEAEQRAKEAIAKVGLADRMYHYPAQLSGGQQQRIGIARAIVANPDIILMDEPTSSLDPGLVEEVLQTIEKLAKDGTTMLIVTHELSFAQRVATNALFMHQGVILENAKTQEFFKHPQHEQTLNFLRKASPDYSFAI
ncbi:MAG: amino acid ABC transporter ATP-binding protein [Oscillospiraceae bacterium]